MSATFVIYSLRFAAIPLVPRRTDRGRESAEDQNQNKTSKTWFVYRLSGIPPSLPPLHSKGALEICVELKEERGPLVLQRGESDKKGSCILCCSRVSCRKSAIAQVCKSLKKTYSKKAPKASHYSLVTSLYRLHVLRLFPTSENCNSYSDRDFFQAPIVQAPFIDCFLFGLRSASLGSKLRTSGTPTLLPHSLGCPAPLSSSTSCPLSSFHPSPHRIEHSGGGGGGVVVHVLRRTHLPIFTSSH